MQPVHVFFFRGLSTYGHDHAKWAVFDFGPVYQHLARALGAREIRFHPVLGMGSGPLTEVAARAKTYIQAHPLWKDPRTPVHFFGHSAGGLVGRLVLERLHDEGFPPGKVLSFLTMASPHKGATLAKICVEMPENARYSTLFLKSVGYDVRAKRHFFDELTAEGLSTVFTPVARWPDGVRTASIVCAAPKSDWCAPLKAFYAIKAFQTFTAPSDGIVDRDSQPFGDVVHEFRVDHFQQVGFFGAGRKFEQIADGIADFFKTTQRHSG